MQEKTDAQLLRDYAEHRNEAAFREIVSRHADVLYASALRQAGSPELAHDIAQSVFTDLARKAQPLARTLTGDASVLGWLFRSTRFVALNQMRDDRRRLARERQAMENFDPASETALEWERVQPVLDEAMADLSDEDRDALLLRFFENRDFRTIGAALGISDDAAQKRVSRALERLRTQLTSRGVTTTAVALSTVLLTNAVPIAPAGLAATLSTAALAGTALATTATATVVKSIAMSTLQKVIIGATLAAAIGTAIYEARQTSSLRSQVQALREQQAEQLVREREEVAGKLAGLRDENERLKRNTAELLKLRAEATRLRGELKSAASVGKTKLDAEPGVVEPVPTNPLPIETYSAKVREAVPWNQILVTGGWKRPDGKRMLVFASPKREGDTAQLTIETRFVEFSEDLAPKLGLEQFLTDARETKVAGVLTTQQYEVFLKAMQDTVGVDLLSVPAVSSPSGRQAQISIPGGHHTFPTEDTKETSSEEKYKVGTIVTVLPTISADGQSVDMAVEVKVTMRTDNP